MVYFDFLHPLGIDFPQFYDASAMFWQKLNMYESLLHSAGPFNYPPSSFLFLWWLALIPYFWAGIVWNLSSLAALLASIYVLVRLGGQRRFSVYFLLLFLFTVPFFPVKHNLGSGQINSFILFFVVSSLYLYSHGRKFSSAFLLAFAIGIKLVPIVFIVYLLIRKDFRQIARMCLILLVLSLVTLTILPWGIQKVYFTQVFFNAFPLSGKDLYYNQSLLGFLTRSFENSTVIRLLQYSLSIAMVLLTFLRGRSLSNLRVIAAISCLYLILHPLAWQHHFVLAVIPLTILATSAIGRKQDKKSYFIAWMSSYLLIAWNIKNPALIPREFNFLLSHQFFGVLLLWALALWQENFHKVLAAFWIVVIALTYALMLLCRGGICL